MFIRFCVIFLSLVFSVSVFAQEQEPTFEPVTEADLEFFAEESYTEAGEANFEEILVSIVEGTRDPEEVVSAFALRTQLPKETAAIYIRLIVDSLIIHESCNEDMWEPGYPDCPEGFEDRFFERLRREGPADQSGRLLKAVDENLEFWGRRGEYYSLLTQNPGAQDLLFRLDRAFFLENSAVAKGGLYGKDYEAILFTIVRKDRSREEIVHEFATEINVPQGLAGRYVDLILQSIRIKEGCARYGLGRSCPNEFDEAYLGDLRKVVSEVKDDRLFATLSRNLALWPRRDEFAALLNEFPNGGDLQLLVDLNYFKEKTYSSLSSDLDESDWEDVLLSLFQNEQDPSKVVTAFAGKFGISEADAEKAIGLIIDSVRIRSTCRQSYGRSSCDYEFEQGALNSLKTVGSIDKTGDLLTAVGKNTTRWRYLPQVLEIIGDHPASEHILLELFDYSHNFQYVRLLITKYGPKTDFIVSGLLTNAIQDAERLAFGEFSRQLNFKTYDNRDDFLFLTALQITNLLDAGLSSRAMAIYQQLQMDEKEAFWTIFARSKGTKNGKSYAWKGLFDLPVELAAAFIESGDIKEGRQILKTLDQFPENFDLGKGGEKRAFLEEFLSPTLNKEEIFDVFINGRTESTDEKAEGSHGPSARKGWLWILERGNRSFWNLGRDYLDDNGYPEMGAYLMTKKLLYHEPGNPEMRTLLSGLMGEGFDDIYQQLLADLKKEITKHEGQQSIPGGPPSYPIKLVVSERPVYFEEKALPEEYKQARADDEPEIEIPEDLALPVDEYQVVRLAKDGDEWVIVYLSTAVDPSGEVSAGGYWIVRSRNQGRDWQDPLYLGLQQYFPYIVVGDSRLPLVEDDVVRLEVVVHELNRESITFPPVGLRAKRREEGLYLEFPWAVIAADGDGDGLTDILERRLGLDPANADTDGDGLDDGVDGLPLTPFDPNQVKNNEIGLEILKQVFGIESSAIVVGMPPSNVSNEKIILSMLGEKHETINPERTVFLSGDPSLFAGLDLNVRFVIYGEGELREMGEQYGVFYPVSVRWIFTNEDKTEFYVIWSASWTGGEFLLKKTEDGVEVDIRSLWIT